MMRINVGCCDLPLPREDGWINVDISTSPHIRADIVADCRDLTTTFGYDEADEIYAGHFVEHLTPTEAEEWVAMCYKVLKPGGILGFVTPDFDYIVKDYLAGNITLERMNNLYIYSYDQESHHASMWNVEEQKNLLARHGFVDIVEIDRMNDPRLAFGVEWQCGVSGRKA